MNRNWEWLLLAAALVASILVFQSLSAESNGEGTGFGGVIFIGPIPLVFGSSPAWALISLILAIVALSLLRIFRPGTGYNPKSSSSGPIWPGESEDGRDEEEGNRKVASEEGHRKRHAEIKGGGVVMIGPIPLLWGSDPRTALLIMLIALAITLIWILPQVLKDL